MVHFTKIKKNQLGRKSLVQTLILSCVQMTIYFNNIIWESNISQTFILLNISTFQAWNMAKERFA